MIAPNRVNPVINIGDIYGDMEVIECCGKYKNGGNKQYKLKCTICGKIKISLDQDMYKRKGITHSTTCKSKNKHKPISIGDIYGDMEVIEEAGFTETKNKKYKCKCKICSNTKIMIDSNIYKGSGLKHTSCSRSNYSGLTSKHPRLYSIWKGMKYRVNNTNSTEYNRYGGRGITIEFKDFKEFVKLMGKSYSMSILNYMGKIILQ